MTMGSGLEIKCFDGIPFPQEGTHQIENAAIEICLIQLLQENVRQSGHKERKIDRIDGRRRFDVVAEMAIQDRI